MTQVKRREHPAEIGPAQTFVVRVVQQIVRVVKVNEAVLQRRQKYHDREGKNQTGNKPANIPGSDRSGRDNFCPIRSAIRHRIF